MRWDDLALLLEVSRASTMSEAARRLRVDQTTVSRRLRAFEERVGLSLVGRRRDGVVLTDAGIRVARAAERMEAVSHDLERQLLGAETELAGRLRVTTVEILAQHHPELFTSFAVAHPRVELEVETRAGRRSLARREADVAIRWTRSADPAMMLTKLVRAEFALYGAASLVGDGGVDIAWAELPWLGLVHDSPAPHVHAFMSSHAPNATVVCRYEDLPPLLAAVRAGAGVGFVPCAYADPDPALVRLRPIEPGFGFDVWCVTHPDLSTTARVASFVDHVVEYFSTRVALYAGH